MPWRGSRDSNKQHYASRQRRKRSRRRKGEVLRKFYLTWNLKHEKVINFKVMFNWWMLEEETDKREMCVFGVFLRGRTLGPLSEDISFCN